MKKIRKAVLPVAGFGTRVLPATKTIPKEMLPILNKPLLQYGVEEALAAGINNMAIVTGRGKRSIEDHFDNAFELEYQLQGTDKEYYLEEIKNIISQGINDPYDNKQLKLAINNDYYTGINKEKQLQKYLEYENKIQKFLDKHNVSYETQDDLIKKNSLLLWL